MTQQRDSVLSMSCDITLKSTRLTSAPITPRIHVVNPPFQPSLHPPPQTHSAGLLLVVWISPCSSPCGGQTAACTTWVTHQAGGTSTGCHRRTSRSHSHRCVGEARTSSAGRSLCPVHPVCLWMCKHHVDAVSIGWALCVDANLLLMAAASSCYCVAVTPCCAGLCCVVPCCCLICCRPSQSCMPCRVVSCRVVSHYTVLCRAAVWFVTGDASPAYGCRVWFPALAVWHAQL